MQSFCRFLLFLGLFLWSFFSFCRLRIFCWFFFLFWFLFSFLFKYRLWIFNWLFWLLWWCLDFSCWLFLFWFFLWWSSLLFYFTTLHMSWHLSILDWLLFPWHRFHFSRCLILCQIYIWIGLNCISYCEASLSDGWIIRPETTKAFRENQLYKTTFK